MSRYKARVPSKHKDYVQSFCRSLQAGDAVYVECQPLAGEPLQECFAVVEKHVIAHGGKQQFGWLIGEITNFWLEAEFHCVWEREDKTLINVAPLRGDFSRILFVPDPERVYRGITVPNRYRAIKNQPIIKEAIAVSSRLGRLCEEYDLASEERRAELASAVWDAKNQMRDLMIRVFQGG